VLTKPACKLAILTVCNLNSSHCAVAPLSKQKCL